MALEYTIQRGDTLSEIAEEMNVDMAELAEANDIEDVNKIYADQKLVIPSKEVNEEKELRVIEEKVEQQRLDPEKDGPHYGPIPAFIDSPGSFIMDRMSNFFVSSAKADEPTPPPTRKGKKRAEPPTRKEKSSTGSFIPENAKAFGRFLAGNVMGLGDKGSDIDVSEFGAAQKKVLRTAMQNAGKDGRTSVTYKDYPRMKDGQIVADFYRKKRGDQGYFDLARASFSDPVFEMFTTLGAFSFKKLDGERFEILPDRYDFDKSKSGGKNRPKAKDSYGSLTYLGQDVSEGQSYAFNVKGII